jgi:hypothetical protein
MERARRRNLARAKRPHAHQHQAVLREARQGYEPEGEKARYERLRDNSPRIDGRGDFGLTISY